MLEIVSQQTRQLESFRADVLLGLSRGRKTLPCRWLYDDRGCELFEEITRLDEYYPTRTETAILCEHAREIADFCGEEAVLLEYGAGAGIKTEILIDALDRPRLYVPIERGLSGRDRHADAAAVPRPGNITRGCRLHI